MREGENPKKKEQRQNPPAPERNPGRGALLFTILSVIASFFFLIYGISTAFGYGVSPRQVAFGFSTAGYGLLSLSILSCAFQFSVRWCITAVQVVAVCYLGIYVVALFVGLRTGFGIGGILLVALLLSINWFAVVKLVRKGRNGA